MRTSSTESSRKPQRVVLVFLLLGLTIDTVCLGAWSAGQVVWMDFLHANPNRSAGDAWAMLARSPLLGAVGALGACTLALIVAAVVAKLASLRTGEVPFWAIVALLPACGLACAMQGEWLFGADQGSPSSAIWAAAIPLSLAQIPALLGCWLWTRRSGIHRPRA